MEKTKITSSQETQDLKETSPETLESTQTTQPIPEHPPRTPKQKKTRRTRRELVLDATKDADAGNNGNTRRKAQITKDLQEAVIRITAARKRTKEKLARTSATFDGLKGKEISLLELDASPDLIMRERDKAKLLNIAPSTMYRVRERVPDWSDRVAKRSLERLHTLLPLADASLLADLRSSKWAARDKARAQLYEMTKRIVKGPVVGVSVDARQQHAMMVGDEELLEAFEVMTGKCRILGDLPTKDA